MAPEADARRNTATHATAHYFLDALNETGIEYRFCNFIPLNTPTVDIGEAQKKFDAAGTLSDEATRERIRQLVAGLVPFTLRLKGGRA